MTGFYSFKRDVVTSAKAITGVSRLIFGNTISINQNMPSSMAVGDTILLCCFSRTGLATDFSAWNLLGSIAQTVTGGGGTIQTLYVYSKVCEASDIGANFILTQSAADRTGLGFLSIRGYSIDNVVTGVSNATASQYQFEIPINPVKSGIVLSFIAESVFLSTSPNIFKGGALFNGVTLPGTLFAVGDNDNNRNLITAGYNFHPAGASVEQFYFSTPSPELPVYITLNIS